MAVRLGVGRGRHALQEEARDRRRTVLDQCLCVAHDILRGPRRCGWLVAASFDARLLLTAALVDDGCAGRWLYWTTAASDDRCIGLRPYRTATVV